VQEQGEVIEVTNRDEVIARLVPDRKSPLTEELLEDEVWADLERLSSEISAHWPAGLSAVDAVRDAKRELFH
jgi:antitoxin (DNA-binding transcriptional repressor) of toxin-antitoxin stability system